MIRIYYFIFLCTCVLYACTTESDPIPVPEELRFQIADDTIPIIMIHGALASGDTYALQAQRFSSNGYPSHYLYTYDWNSLGQMSQDETLDLFIDNVLAETGMDMVNIMGHSAGGGVGYSYLADDARAGKVNKYVHIGSFPNAAAAGSEGQIPTLNLYSSADLVVSGSDIMGATNVQLDDLDHYEIATSRESFQTIFSFLHSEEPTTTDIIQEDQIELSGRVVTLGENVPQSSVEITIYKIDAVSCFREDAAEAVLITDEEGNWGGFQAEQETLYEFEIRKPSDAEFRTIHYYREAFIRSDQFVYLRSFPGPGSLAGILLSGVPRDDAQAAVVIFSSSQAIINGRDNLFLRDIELSTPELTSADQTTIAMFCYDEGNDQNGSEAPISVFSALPFLNGIDVFIPTNEAKTIKLDFNGRNLFPRNWKSESEGVSVVVFN